MILALTAVNAFFVAVEMAFVRVRRTRIDELAEGGSYMAKIVQRYNDDPDTFFSGSQLGITIAMLAVGAIGESAFAEDLAKWMKTVGESMGWPTDMMAVATASCYVVVFAITAYIQVILGELLPKSLTFQRAESVMLTTILPMHIWCTITKPFLFIMSKTMSFIVKVFKIPEPPKHLHSEEELKMLVSASQEHGVLEEGEEEMLHSVFEFSDTVASEIMTPRRDMVCISADKEVRDLVAVALETGHSRVPVFDEDIDSIIGLVHIRDGLKAFVEGTQDRAVRELARRVLIVPENKGLTDLLTEFKKTKTHMAIVVDEHGGTEGMVTLEDLLEELVGDIADEHDIVEEMILPGEDGSVLIDARMDLEEVNDKLGLDIEDDQFTTLGGHVFGCLGHEPSVGDEINTDDYTLRIEEADRHRITKLRLIRKERETAAKDGSTDSGVNPTNGKPTRHTKDDSVSHLEAS